MNRTNISSRVLSPTEMSIQEARRDVAKLSLQLEKGVSKNLVTIMALKKIYILRKTNFLCTAELIIFTTEANFLNKAIKFILSFYLELNYDRAARYYGMHRGKFGKNGLVGENFGLGAAAKEKNGGFIKAETERTC